MSHKGNSDAMFWLDGKRFPYQNASCLRFNSPTGFLRLLIPSSDSVHGSIALTAVQSQPVSTTLFQWLTFPALTGDGIPAKPTRLARKRHRVTCAISQSSTAGALIRSKSGANSFLNGFAYWRFARRLFGARMRLTSCRASSRVSLNSSVARRRITSNERGGSTVTITVPIYRTCFTSLC